MANPKLKRGDTVILLYMDGETLPPGISGVVTKSYELFGTEQYDVDWENGSKLSLIAGEDAWKLKPTKEQIKEDDQSDFIANNLDILRLLNMNFFVNYLKILKESGITNMMGSAPYLYTGRERIEHEFKYKHIPNEEAFEELLDKANTSQAYMINGVIDYLNKKGLDENMENINKYVRLFSNKIVNFYILS
jgi:hypothetical protein